MVWLLNGKVNKEAGAVCFDTRIVGKKPIQLGMILSKIDGIDVRHLAIL